MALYYSNNMKLFPFCMFWCVVVCGVSATSCNFNVRLTQSLLNEGFHRNVTYEILFNADDEVSRWRYKGCIMALDQKLPRGVFASPDELEDLRRTGRLHAIPTNKVNIELPAEDSHLTTFYIVGKVTSSKLNLWLPVHARYQQAKSGGGTVRNELDFPKMYLRCPDRRLDACISVSSPALTFLCNGLPEDKCSWKEIPYTAMSKNLTWDVPVGNMDHMFIVMWGTMGIVGLGSVYLLKIIHEFKIAGKNIRR